MTFGSTPPDRLVSAAADRPAEELPDRPRRIVVGVGGGIAAYKACDLLRRLRADGHDVVVVPTRAALAFVGAPTWEALSGHPVSADTFFDVPAVTHVATGQQADLVIIAPATADVLARAATGQADDLLTATLLVTRAPVLMAPAMHTEMWTHPATVANVATLRRRGVVVVDPAVGRLTGADSGPGRLPEPEHLAQLADLLLRRPDALPFDLAGRRVVVSAGGTREPLDPVRYLGNRSSGRQGWAIALVAAARGADVTLVAANVDLVEPPGVRVRTVGSAAQLHEAMLDETSAGGPVDAVVMTAAVADYRPVEVAAVKLKKVAGQGPPALTLAENPDILAALSTSGPSRPTVVVGFAAETGDGTADPEESVLAFGRDKLRRKGCDVLVVNRVDAGRAFGRPDNAAVLLARSDHGSAPAEADVEVEATVPLGPKAVLAAAVTDALARRLGGGSDLPVADRDARR